MPTKVCNKCSKERELREFYNNKTNKDGKDRYCISCRKLYTSEMRKIKKLGDFSQRYQPTSETKKCTRCGIEKNLCEFAKELIRSSGYSSVCKTCECKRSSEYYNRNKEKVSEKKAGYWENNREILVERGRRYKSTHIKELHEWASKYRKDHKLLILTRNRVYFGTPRGKFVQRRSQHKRRSISKNVECSLTLDQWEKIIKLQENKCVICGKRFTKKNPATKDHIIPVTHYGPFTMENTQAAHHSCNSSKGNRVDKSNIVSWVTRPDLCITTEFLAN